MINKIDHIGIAVESIEKELPYYQNILGLELVGIEQIERENVRVAILKIGESYIELLESTDPSSAIARHIQQRGQGIAHIALNVNNAAQSLNKLKENNVRPLSETPMNGAHNSKIFFTHPKDTGNVLYEYCEKSDKLI